MAGIHLHHYDLAQEDHREISALLSNIDDLSQLFVQVNSIFERNPSPIGTLEHNPISDVVMGTGTFHANLDLESMSPRLHQVVDSGVLSGDDPLEAIRDSALASEYEVIPWINIANGAWAGDVEANCVVDFAGNPVVHWLCPNGHEVVEMWAKTIVGLKRRYGFATYLIDRIRYPDWGGQSVRPASLFSCFCTTCVTQMGEAGIDVPRLRSTMRRIADTLSEGDYEHAVTALRTDRSIQRWIRFRQSSVTGLVARLVDRARELDPAITLWLDLWPPSYSWLLGQDYASLTELSPRLKHFPYHRLGGGADVQSLIGYFADTPAARESAFTAFLKLFDFPYDLTYTEFVERGFPIEFVATENKTARRMSARGTYIYSGVQMWNLPPNELYEAALAGYASSADDLIYYCYGWASARLFGAANGALAAGRSRRQLENGHNA